MLFDLPSSRGFQPHFFVGGPGRFYLPLAYDLVRTGQPRTVVTLGFGDGEIHFTFCQAVREGAMSCDCLALRAPDNGEPKDDNAWQAGISYSREFYDGISRLREGAPEDVAPEFGDGSVDLLLLNDCDSYPAARRQFDIWAPKISDRGITLVHGIGTRRDAGVAQFWREIKTEQSAEFSAGIGMGIISRTPADSPFVSLIAGQGHAEIEQLYLILASRIETESRGAQTERENRMLQLKQAWLPSLLDDRIQMQDTIDHLNRHIAHITRVYEWNERQLQARADALEAQLAEKNVSRQMPAVGNDPVNKEERKLAATVTPRSIPQRIGREIRHIPGNLRRLWRGSLSSKQEENRRNR